MENAHKRMVRTHRQEMQEMELTHLRMKQEMLEMTLRHLREKEALEKEVKMLSEELSEFQKPWYQQKMENPLPPQRRAQARTVAAARPTPGPMPGPRPGPMPRVRAPSPRRPFPP